MKIVYLVHQFFPEFYTGTEKFVLNLSSMMQKAGHRVKVIAYSFQEDSFYNRSMGDFLCKDYTYRGIPVLALRQKQVPDDHTHALENRKLSEIAGELIATEKPDIVHVGHTLRVGALAQILPILKIPYVVTLTDFFLACPKVNLITSEKKLCGGPEGGAACARLCPELSADYFTNRLNAAREFLSGAKLVAAPSKFVAGIFKREFPGLEVQVIHHGLNYHRLQRNEKIYSRNDPVVFCYAGSFNPHKGPHVLVEAFKKISSTNASLKIYGSGIAESYVKNLKSLAQDDTRIEFRGAYPAEKIGEIVSAVDVLAIPSLCYESYSMILHEALASNVPVVATNLGGLAEKIEDGVNSFLFSMGDAEQLQALLQRIVDEPEILNPLKRNIDRMLIPTIEQEAYAYSRVYRAIKDASFNAAKNL